MTPAQHFVQEVCRVRAPCLHALLQRENNQKRAGLQVCRQGGPFSLEKRKREKGEKRKKKPSHACTSCKPARPAQTT